MISTIIAAALGGALCVGSIWLHKERNKPAPEQVDIAAVVAATMQQYQVSEQFSFKTWMGQLLPGCCRTKQHICGTA